MTSGITMKKNNIFYACAAVALVFASCQKEGPSSEINDAPSSGIKVITASAVPTKTTTLDGINVLWENVDQISLFALVPTDNPEKPTATFATYTTTLDAPSATASFVKDEANTVEPTKSNGKYLAFYFKGATNVTKSRNLNSVYVVDKEQVAKNGGDFASSIMYAASENTTFQFSHLVSYLKFTVDENTTPFTKLTVSSADESQYVASRIQVDFASDIAITLIPVNPSNGNAYTQSSKTVSVTTDDNAAFAPGTYYMAINADTYAAGLNLTFDNGTSTYTIPTPANVVLNRGDVANLGVIGALEFEPVPEEPEQPEVPVSSALGTVYAEGGVNQGVVFWVNPENPANGKIISGASTSLKWGNGTAKSYTWAADINTNDGMANQAYVLGLDGSSATEYPAVYYCKDMGEGWRLPTITEMEALIKTYYGLSGDYDTTTKYFEVEPYASNAVAFEAELSKCNPTAPLATSAATWYWTGQSYYKDGDTNSGKMCRVKISSQILVSGSNATNACCIRCVREVNLQ